MAGIEAFTEPRVDLGFDERDLSNLLDHVNPAWLPRVSGSYRGHVARIPNRDDILLRWTTKMDNLFPVSGGQAELEDHLNTYEQRLGRLAAAGEGVLYVPAHFSVAVAQCRWQQQRVIYSVVERLETTPLEHSENYSLIGQTARILADDAAKPTPHIWDHTKITQYGERKVGNTRQAALLDLENFLTFDPRHAYVRLPEWGVITKPHDGGALLRYIHVLGAQARERHAARHD